MPKLERILIVAEASSEEIDHFVSALYSCLQSAGVDSICWSPKERDLPNIEQDLIIVIGGDGSLMSLLRVLGHPPVPIYGVNFGRVGFLMNPRQEPAALVDTLLGGAFVEQQLPVLSASWTNSGGESGNAAGINDVVLERDSGQTVHLGLYIDDVLLNAYSGDGLVISTPAGSTAYSLAAGGPVVHPDVDGIVVTPLNAHRPVQFHSLQFPLIVPLGAEIRVVGEGCDKRPIRVVVDGESFSGIEELSVSARGDSVHLLRPQGYQYIQRIVSRIIGNGEDAN
ncbi:MAG: NAD(+)/NADH kinase [Planctomycetota bacterium]|nr:NAD(+)/NADH kinase [Planctomycetota bacterium]